MSAPKSIEVIKIINALKSLRTNIRIPSDYHEQMIIINSLLSNDKTGIVNTVLDFMSHSATVPMKIETQNATLDKNLKLWQTTILNKNISLDIPRGLRELSTEYYRERYKSSFIALNVKWENVTFPNKDEFVVPTRMWLADGSSIYVDGRTNGLNTKKYFLGKTDRKPLNKKLDRSVLIRKPFNSWYEKYPTPFLARRGVLFNALLKEAIVSKQADVIESIIPYLLLLRAGTEKLAELDMLAGEPELQSLKESIVKAKEEHDITGEIGKTIAALNFDVNVEHLMPDLAKIFDSKITNSTDKNILAGMGMIELQGFASDRQETILNPKMLVEEVRDGVGDWASLLEEVMYEMMERNKKAHPKLSNNIIRVVPGKIKAFVTEGMRVMLRSMYDRGVLSKQTGAEDIADIDFEVEVERRQKENERGLNEKMYPHIIQNVEQFVEPKLEDQNKAPNTPEADNFNNAILKNYKKRVDVSINAPFDIIDQLPDNVKNVLPIPAQIIWLNAFNSAIDSDHTEEDAFQIAWGAVKRQYEKKPGKDKWVKKS